MTVDTQSITDVLSEITHLRGLTLDLLTRAPESFLNYSPHTDTGDAWKIFRHMARVDENYIAGIRTGTIQFGFADSDYQLGNDRKALLAYLQRTSENLNQSVNTCGSAITINWFGENCTLLTHLIRLATHESLHHGQLILYARAAGISLPPSWAAWGG